MSLWAPVGALHRHRLAYHTLLSLWEVANFDIPWVNSTGVSLYFFVCERVKLQSSMGLIGCWATYILSLSHPGFFPARHAGLFPSPISHPQKIFTSPAESFPSLLYLSLSFSLFLALPPSFFSSISPQSSPSLSFSLLCSLPRLLLSRFLSHAASQHDAVSLASMPRLLQPTKPHPLPRLLGDGKKTNLKSGSFWQVVFCPQDFWEKKNQPN